MANFSVNQVLQFYAAKAYNATVNDESAVGTIGNVKVVEDTPSKQLLFLFKGAGGVLRSDLIQVQNINCVKVIKAADMATKMKKVKIVLNPEVAEGKPVSGQDYVLSINFRNFFSSGDASQYFKDAAVHATSAMTAEQFYAGLEKSLNAAFSREPNATNTSNPYVKFSSDANGLYIEEKPQEWELGKKKARRIMFDVFCSTIYTGGDDLIWGTIEEVESTTTVGNGQKIADLEWFAAGERGDQYRDVCGVNKITTKYLVDPEKEYNVLEIHHAFTDTGVNSYRTEKDITIVSEDVAVLNSFIAEINSKAGLNIETLCGITQTKQSGEREETPLPYFLLTNYMEE